MLPKMRGYGNRFDETKYISFLIKDDRLLKKYNKILDKVCMKLKEILKQTNLKWKTFKS